MLNDENFGREHYEAMVKAGERERFAAQVERHERKMRQQKSQRSRQSRFLGLLGLLVR